MKILLSFLWLILLITASCGDQSSDSTNSSSSVSHSDNPSVFYSGGVEESSRHYSDAQDLFKILRQQGFTPRVRISISEGETYYVLSYDGKWFGDSYEFENDCQCIEFAFSAIGLISAQTTWRSSHAVVFFEDNSWALSTAACRLLTREFGYPPIAGAGIFIADNAQCFQQGLQDY